MAESEPASPKIIVDEDWKSRVAAEKEHSAAKSIGDREAEKQEAAKHEAAHAAPPSEASTESPPSKKDSGPAAAAHEQAAPPATLSFLVTTLGTQAMVALGEINHPLTGKAEIRLTEARHFIDILDMLEEKTAGNRSPEESSLLDAVLHQLRLSYVDRKAHPGKS